MTFAGLTAGELLAAVRRQVQGPMLAFVIARLSLRCGVDLNHLDPDEDDPAMAERLRVAMNTVCPQVLTVGTLERVRTPHLLTLVGGEPELFHCHHYNVVLQQSIEDAGAAVDAPGILTEGATIVAHAQLRAVSGDAPARLALAAEHFRRAGLGLIDLTRLTAEGGPATLERSHYALGFQARRLARTTPGCYFAAGWAAGALAAAHDLPAGAFGAVETACAAAGAPRCELRLERLASPRPLPPSPGLGVVPPTLPPRVRVDTNVDEEAVLAALSRLPFVGNEEGLIPAFGLYLTRHYANYYNYISTELLRRLDPSLVEVGRAVLVESGHVCAFNTLGGIMESPEWQALVEPMCRDRADWVSGIVACINAFGWGRWSVAELVAGERLVVRVDAGYEANYVLAREGRVDRPTCFLCAGGVAGIMNLLWVGDVTRRAVSLQQYDRLFSGPDSFRAVERRCRAMGDEVCEFVAERHRP